MLTLLETYDFEDISVNKLCEQACVGRGTFYKHFADKYEFLSFIVREQYQTYLDKIPSSIQSNEPAEYYQGLFQICMDFCEQSPLLISSWRQSKNIDTLTKVVSKIVVPDISKRIEQDQKKGYVLPFDSHLTAQLICSIMMQTVTWWFTNRDKISRKEVLRQFHNVLSRLISTKMDASFF